MKDYIDALSFKNMILCADAALHANVQKINELNVFPVPDGDTGTNMGLTLKTAADELRKKDFATVEEAAACTANGLLRGARGNSGVILSLLFRGISKRLKGLETAGASEFAGAMCDGVDAAYKAVMKPAEGTILTVSRIASKAGKKAADLGSDLEGMFMCAIKAGDKALAETTDQNPVLKKAGVVDAGGMGYLVILKTMLEYLRGSIEVPAESGEVEDSKASGSAFDVFDTEEITFAFDTVYVVRKDNPDVDLDPLRKYLNSIGDSLVIGESDEEFKVHVHTDIPGSALTESQKYGTLELAKIENMRSQHEAIVSGKQARTTDNLEEVEQELEKQAAGGTEDGVAAPEKEYGSVSVCAGEGLEALFRELGADGIVSGGQTMNPSTDDILKEINKTPANTVFVFPNNKNIIMAAEQCIPLTEKKVVVIPSKTVPQGITAMLNMNGDASEDELVESMTAAMENVHTAMVTYAARDSEFDGHEIHSGEYLALLDGKLVGNYANTTQLFKELTWEFNELSPEFITIYYGSDVTEEDANAVCETIFGVFPDAEVSVIMGGQPVYYYMISVE